MKKLLINLVKYSAVTLCILSPYLGFYGIVILSTMTTFLVIFLFEANRKIRNLQLTVEDQNKLWHDQIRHNYDIRDGLESLISRDVLNSLMSVQKQPLRPKVKPKKIGKNGSL